MSDIPVPVRYFEEASSINFRRSARYGFLTLVVMLQYWLNRLKIWKLDLFSQNQQYLVD